MIRKIDSNKFSLTILKVTTFSRIRQIDNKTQVDYQFSVGDKFKKHENSSELGYIVSLHVDVKVPKPLPEVKPSEGSSGGFDVTIKDWGKPEDIDMEL